jgi:hypothetical protein
MSSFTEIGIAKQNFANATLDAFPGVVIKSLKAVEKWKSNMLMDSQGAWNGQDARDVNIELDVDYEMTAASKALAAVNGNFALPLSGVAISGADLPWLNATGVNGRYTGNWCSFEPGSRTLSPDKNGEGTLKLRKFADPTQNAQQFVVPA